MIYLNESIGKEITYQSTNSPSGGRAVAGRAVGVHYPSAREQCAAFRARPAVLKMFLLHVSNDGGFA